MTEHQIRMRIWLKAFKLARGNRQEQTEALESINHLLASLNNRPSGLNQKDTQ